MALRISHCRDTCTRRGVVAAGGRVNVINHVPGLSGHARHRPGAGLGDIHVKAGVRPGRQQVGVVAENAILPICQPGHVKRGAARPKGQQVGKLRQTRIHYRGPGAVNRIPALHHHFQSIEQRKHHARGVGIDRDIRTSARTDRKADLRRVVAEQRQHVAKRADQQGAVVAVLGGRYRRCGAEFQLLDVRTRGKWHNRSQRRAWGRGVARRIGGGDLQRLTFRLFIEEAVAVGASGVRRGGDRRTIRQTNGDGAACFGGACQHAAIGVEGAVRRVRGDGVDDDRRR
ncbi:hypothetical protein D3C72_349470 [compost metagenome]